MTFFLPRFAVYRQYVTSVDSVRVDLVRDDAKAGCPPRRRRSSADVAAARAELAAYYAQYRGDEPSKAAQMAANAVSAMVTAGQECD